MIYTKIWLTRQKDRKAYEVGGFVDVLLKIYDIAAHADRERHYTISGCKQW